jgi:hypothetical protein
MKILIGGGVKTKPILKREWAFLFFNNLRTRNTDTVTF